MALLDELTNKVIPEALKGAKPRYATLKEMLSDASGYPVACINPKNISKHNQASPRISETARNRSRCKESTSGGWLPVFLISADSVTERDQIIKSIIPELQSFATAALIFERAGNSRWSLSSLHGATSFSVHNTNLATSLGINADNIETYDMPPSQLGAAPPSSRPQLPADLFISEEKAELIFDRLRTDLCVVLEGPPGVGKSFLARQLAGEFVESPDQIERVQFHQSYGYEDFVCGWRPDGTGSFAVSDGVFLDFCSKAVAPGNQDSKFLLIIDEINRANVSKVLGELMTLLEPDKREPCEAMRLAYPRSEPTFFVPGNVHILATMNTADRSLSMVDYALRRRFAFVDINPAFSTEELESYLMGMGVASETVDLINERMTALNEQIREDRRNLGPGYEIGHSYFVPKSVGKYGQEWYEAIITTKIAPLIREYWFDDDATATALITELTR